ncbi:MAG TPA: RibD family protein, partial [Solirubrobacterales bacterium]|nr:RibD family protein [Solirubrobacterales bacterium]
GIGTVLADDPLLTARPDPSAVPSPAMARKRNNGTGVRQPLRVVFDRQARLPLDSQLLRTLDEAPVLVVASQGADADRLAALREAGAETLIVDGVDAALAELGRRWITSLFLEGGRTLASAFLDADAIDEARVFVAPILLGAESTEGEGGGVRASAASPSTRPDIPTLAPRPEVEQIGNDVLISTRFKEW